MNTLEAIAKSLKTSLSRKLKGKVSLQCGRDHMCIEVFVSAEKAVSIEFYGSGEVEAYDALSGIGDVHNLQLADPKFEENLDATLRRLGLQFR